MNPLLKNILAVILGWLIGSVVNMAIVMLGHTVLPIDGVNPNDMDALVNAMLTLEAKYFIFPFLAHALGTFAGTTFAGWMAASYKLTFAFIVGGLFLLGGIAANYMIPGPTWFAITDIVLAYIPMAWIGGKLGLKLSKN